MQKLSKKLQDWTGRRWSVALSNEPGDPTIREQREAKTRAEIESQRTSIGREAGACRQVSRRDGLAGAAEGRARTGARVSPQAVVNEDGDVVVGEMEFTEEDL